MESFLAPAKINICLHVLGRREDGYHELAMLMQRVSLYDRISLSFIEGNDIRVQCDGLTLPLGQKNIAARAAQALFDRAGIRRGLDIVIEKNIPVAAGLGGGSSDAATVLMGLNDMLGLGLSATQLMQEGVKLGADVPFFIYKHPAWATGIGDKLQEVEGLPPVWYVLVNPGLEVSTAWVYQNLRLTSARDNLRIPRFSGTVDEVVELLHNDLETVTVERFPLIGEIKQQLLGLGARGALMSGSGSTVFGVFSDGDTARAAAENLSSRSGWRAFAVEPVND
ncbi:4-diphosphocytidyl-2-C-methyl-D-erythritol kinase [Syntrophotalea carbinolica DSM 2380]|uniref:4-diphosphocytidyl-2-C-methyl-D-erythritol kinase n=1 Tax=Syntrophotalea carbinolica (strain DSM 2380 / NBRC 103641 / GraBd1) TaxID=338963 RepID=ISPE_SYNC1|nr:4-(cytidine 5'-diphospho)-2-C-methyl-D-erythritol kinase [Syntrophotalea carbinolica]Q3A311.1 RecName: Full=4-diphosphocytidyl-2-C-methyl-D-erythritol kinase; Short=CMK; AltName: Full=4-(cytidine-5'-diphospho)-2-C-methyl-D-erythritol kinase [Syntrophotalea carbinolica DSM 2380]ABA89246.1 4-diphosphocytidyl-2-C-methyl-D-erythritol kinase [Syntrophotalea carbinolica DSM 2380]